MRPSVVGKDLVVLATGEIGAEKVPISSTNPLPFQERTAYTPSFVGAVNSAAASTQLAAANASRKGLLIANTDANDLLIDITGGAASAARHAQRVPSGGTAEILGITGVITGIWTADGAGAALVTELL